MQYGGRHVPGSGIDFRQVRRHWCADTEVRPLPVGHAAYGRIKVSNGERLVEIAQRFDVGDIVITRAPNGRSLAIGRPMQVRESAGAASIMMDDPSLGRTVRVVDELARLLGGTAYGPAAVWIVLDLWHVYRCPSCGSPGLRLIHGLSGPPEPGFEIGGCMLWPDGGDGDVTCSRCPAIWAVRHYTEVARPGSPDRRSPVLRAVRHFRPAGTRSALCIDIARHLRTPGAS
jgi:hypothetical protein